MQALYLQALDPVAETRADRNSYGFRRYRSCADAIAQCFNVLATRRAPEWVLEADIEACFDRIEHDWLLEHVPLEGSILRKWLKAGYMERHVLHPTEEGAPQGGVLSPVLANLALDGLEARLARAFPKSTRRGTAAKVNLVRYADDFIITGSSRELLEDEVRPLVEAFLQERGLRLSAEKTLITHIQDGFDFLGQNVRKYGGNRAVAGSGKLLIQPARKNVRTFLENLRKLVKNQAQATAAHLVWLLNPKIVGWANYHRHVVSKRVFARVDHELFGMLWRWAVRRHPNKGRRWVKARYFTQVDGNRWVFFGTEVVRSQGRRVPIARASRTRITRHVKIRSEVNPYAPEWSEYLQRRATDASRPIAPGARETGWGLNVCRRPKTQGQSGRPRSQATPRPSRGVREA
jgi:RNA-directed DNA polymerase